MKPIPVARRFMVALVACFVSAAIFRSELALALVGRGDDVLTRGNTGGARVYYGRALWLDPGSAPAVDRYAFASLQQRTPQSLRDAIETATAYLLIHPDQAAIRADRALCYLILKRYQLAAIDFRAAAVQLHSAQYFTFAGWARYRLGQRRAARRLWSSALRFDASYGPAAGALRRTVE